MLLSAGDAYHWCCGCSVPALMEAAPKGYFSINKSGLWGHTKCDTGFAHLVVSSFSISLWFILYPLGSI